MHHTFRRYWVTPDTSTLAISQALGVSRVRCPRVAQRTRSPRRQLVSALPPSSSQLCDDHETILGHEHMQSTNFGTANEKRCVPQPLLWWAELEQRHASILLPPEPCQHRRIRQLVRDQIHQNALDHFLRHSRPRLLLHLVTGLTGRPAGRLGTTSSAVPIVSVTFVSRPSTGVRTLHFAQRKTRFRRFERTSSMKKPP